MNVGSERSGQNRLWSDLSSRLGIYSAGPVTSARILNITTSLALKLSLNLGFSFISNLEVSKDKEKQSPPKISVLCSCQQISEGWPPPDRLGVKFRGQYCKFSLIYKSSQILKDQSPKPQTSCFVLLFHPRVPTSLEIQV